MIKDKTFKKIKKASNSGNKKSISDYQAEKKVAPKDEIPVSKKNKPIICVIS